jgi:hypothetical protein
MAGEWIKMRIDLQSHPKVVRILSAMRPQDGRDLTDKFRVIGGLHAVWSVFDLHSEDGRLCGYTPELMDHIIGWKGFSQAMIAVGWLRFDGSETLDMPEFSEHNGQSAKRRAEDQKRKRNGRKTVRNLSASPPDKLRTESGLEIEKKENKEQKTAPEAEWFAGVPEQVVHDFRALRRKLRAEITKTAMDGIRREAGKAGISLTEALTTCCERGWRGFKAEWVQGGNPSAPVTCGTPRRRRELGT